MYLNVHYLDCNVATYMYSIDIMCATDTLLGVFWIRLWQYWWRCDFFV